MTQQKFFQMLYTPDGHQWSKLESFLAASILVRQFSKVANESTDTNNANVRIDPKLLSTYSKHILDTCCA